MKINFNDINLNQQKNINTSNSLHLENTREIRKTFSQYEISPSEDNSVFKENRKKCCELKNEADSKMMNLDSERNYMAVMSNCMSDEDFAKMQEEGFDPSSTDFEDSVTIIDHIKTALLKGGTQIVGYTDNLSKEELTKLTNSVVNAESLISQFETKDIPLTEENVRNIEDSYELFTEIMPLSESGVQYLIENELKPTVNNLYKASYSSGEESKPGYEYYVEDMGGYLSKKSEDIDMKVLMPSIEKVIEKADLPINDDTLGAAEWLLEKGVDITPENLNRFFNLESIDQNMSFEEFSDIATNAIMDGILVKDADLSRKTSMRNEALAINDEVQTLGTIRGRRVLEEVRLSMTTEANLKLLKSGFSIDTLPMEELIHNLKEIEKEYAINLTKDDDEIEAVRKKNIFEDSISAVKEIRNAPISISIVTEKSWTLESVRDKGRELTNIYEKAGNAYESLMTAPRSDMGDSIKKAFSNVDDILQDLGEALTDENRRAVRILGYNSIKINPQNLNEVKEKDQLLSGTIEKMTPQRVLTMIRSNINPMTMSVEELDSYLSNIDTTKDDLLSFSKFLYKLEQSNGISENEREAYIGMYRLIHQLESSDYRSIGAISELNVQFNLDNMLSTLRSVRKKHMDYKVDDDFGSVEVIDRGIASISSQIAKGQIKDTTDLKRVLESAGSKESEEEFDRDQYEEIRKSFDTETRIIEELRQADLSLSSDNIISANSLMNDPSSVFKKLREAGFKKKNDIRIESREKLTKDLETLSEDAREYLESKVFEEKTEPLSLKYQDIRAYAMIVSNINYLKERNQSEDYEIPVEINGELTAINLKLIHSDIYSNVAISFETERYGKVAAYFSQQDNGISGYCNCQSKEGNSILSSNQAILFKNLDNEGIKLSKMYFVENDRLDLPEFKAKVTKDEKNDKDVVSSDELYKLAKGFIDFAVKAQSE